MADGRTDGPKLVYVGRPPKPVSEMTDKELDAWCDKVIEVTRQER
jgi:predicted transcriptional regulator